MGKLNVELTNSIFFSMLGFIVWAGILVGLIFLGEQNKFYYLLLVPYLWVTIYFFNKITGIIESI